MNTLISIILPVYNSEEYIEKTLLSLREQSFNDIEILCIDDGSTDKSPAILDKFAETDDRIKVFHQKNSGPATARNVGLSNAVGKYLMFCDSDDTYTPDMCRKMYETIEDNKVDCVCSGANTVNLSPNIDISVLSNERLGCGIFSSDSKRVIRRPNVFLWNKIFKKELVDKYNITFPDGYKADDDAFVLSYFLVADKIMYIADKLYNYYPRPGGILYKLFSKDCDDEHFDRLYAAKHFYDFSKRHNLNHLEKSRRILHHFLTTISWYADKSWKGVAKEEGFALFRKMFPEHIDWYASSVKPKLLSKKKFFRFFTLEIYGKIKEHFYVKRYVYKYKDKKLFSYSIKIKNLLDIDE